MVDLRVGGGGAVQGLCPLSTQKESGQWPLSSLHIFSQWTQNCSENRALAPWSRLSSDNTPL